MAKPTWERLRRWSQAQKPTIEWRAGELWWRFKAGADYIAFVSFYYLASKAVDLHTSHPIAGFVGFVGMAVMYVSFRRDNG